MHVHTSRTSDLVSIKSKLAQFLLLTFNLFDKYNLRNLFSTDKIWGYYWKKKCYWGEQIDDRFKFDSSFLAGGNDRVGKRNMVFLTRVHACRDDIIVADIEMGTHEGRQQPTNVDVDS